MSLLNLKGHHASAAVLAAIEKVFVEKGSEAAYAYSKDLGQDYTVDEFYQVLKRDRNTGQKIGYTPDQMTYQIGSYLAGMIDGGNVGLALAKSKEFGFDFASLEDLKRAVRLSVSK